MSVMFFVPSDAVQSSSDNLRYVVNKVVSDTIAKYQSIVFHRNWFYEYDTLSAILLVSIETRVREWSALVYRNFNT